MCLELNECADFEVESFFQQNPTSFFIRILLSGSCGASVNRRRNAKLKTAAYLRTHAWAGNGIGSDLHPGPDNQRASPAIYFSLCQISTLPLFGGLKSQSLPFEWSWKVFQTTSLKQTLRIIKARSNALLLNFHSPRTQK